MGKTEWLKSLKVGDEVLITEGRFFPTERIGIITNICSDYVEVGTRKIDKIKGYSIKDGWHVEINELTDMKRDELQKEEKISMAKTLMRECARNLSYDNAIKIIGILGG